ncbi:hypothetical protein HMPREF9999_00561 [Alloprevotella sp. oral taxon 473 str. F0040]|nr:hypothetical protein HMPREF9999_00561 [Alloprevotella sp. oral taxon 473 str. F0040]
MVGDAVNLLLAAAAYNFKRAMRALLTLLNNKRNAKRESIHEWILT